MYSTSDVRLNGAILDFLYDNVRVLGLDKAFSFERSDRKFRTLVARCSRPLTSREGEIQQVVARFYSFLVAIG